MLNMKEISKDEYQLVGFALDVYPVANIHTRGKNVENYYQFITDNDRSHFFVACTEVVIDKGETHEFLSFFNTDDQEVFKQALISIAADALL